MAEQNRATYVEHEEMWFRNFSENLRYMKYGSSLLDLPKHSGSIIAVAAGPSFKKALPYLKRTQLPIVAVDRCLKPLLKADIKPAYVVSIDGSRLIEKFFPMDNSVKDITLIMMATGNPIVARKWRGHRVWMLPNFDRDAANQVPSLTRAIQWMSNCKTVVQPLGNCGSHGWQAADYLTGDSVILTGVDFSYGGVNLIKPEATELWKHWRKKLSAEKAYRKYSSHRSLTNRWVLTDEYWKGQKDVLEAAMNPSVHNVINTSPYSIVGTTLLTGKISYKSIDRAL